MVLLTRDSTESTGIVRVFKPLKVDHQ